jgi:hypothetical protein
LNNENQQSGTIVVGWSDLTFQPSQKCECPAADRAEHSPEDYHNRYDRRDIKHLVSYPLSSHGAAEILPDPLGRPLRANGDLKDRFCESNRMAN